MDPVSLVLTALASGAVAGVSDSASDAVKAAYAKLRALVAGKFAGDKKAEMVLAEHADDPGTWQAPLQKALTAAIADTDQLIVIAAQDLMTLLDEKGSAEGKYRVSLSGAQGVQVGDGNHQFNVFTTPPPG